MANVTPGYTFTGPTDPITYTKLNLLGQPTVTIGSGEITPSMISAAAWASPSGPIGATTPVAGTFTTLNATGIITSTSGSSSYFGASTGQGNVTVGNAAPSADSTTILNFIGSNAARNWRLAANVVGGEFSITPSTAGGGTTFTTPVLLVSTAGLAVTGALASTGAGSHGIGISATTTLNLAASTTGVSSIRLAHGSAPTAPVDGDMWTTTAGLYVRINGGTVGPLS